MKKIRKGIILFACLLITCFMAIACTQTPTFTVSFETNGGVAITTVTKNEGEEYILPKPVRDGYRFDGWFLNENYTGNQVESITVRENVTVYAKWTQVALVTLDAKGGTLNESEVYLPVGAKLLEGLNGLVPQKTGLEFGGWFNGNSKVTDATKVPADGLNLTARYIVEYTVEVYLQDLDGSGYTQGESVKEKDYVDKEITVDVYQTGFSQITHDNEVLSGVLSETASENIFKAYYDRREFVSVLDPNYPDRQSGDAIIYSELYGTEVVVPFDLAKEKVEGYCFLGWTSNLGGSVVEFPADLNERLFGYEGDTAQEQKYKIEDYSNLYGVWQKGYTDQFGGNDYIYLIEGEQDAIYLDRGGVMFLGEYYDDDNTFYFYDYSKDEFGELVLRGKLIEGNKFLYNDSQRAVSRVLYVPGTGINENVKLRFDSLNGATYTVYDEESGQKVSESTGTYEMISIVEYRANFTAGEMAGKSLSFYVGSVTIEGQDAIPAFQARNEDDLAVGKVILLGIIKDTSNNLVFGSLATSYIEFDGFGKADFTSASGKSTYTYVKDENGRYILTNSMGTENVAISIVTHNGISGFMLYEQSLDRQFILLDGGTLTLDGTHNALFKKGDKEISSYYTIKSMPMGGTMVTIVEQDGSKYNEKNFLITFVDEEKTSYVAKEVLNTYQEFYYQDGKSTYYAPMMVFDETATGEAIVYGYTKYGKYEKVLKGTYKDNGDGTYTFIRTELFKDADVMDDPIDLTAVSSIKFAIDTQTYGYAVHYWHESNEENEYFISYTSGTEQIKLIGSFVFYTISATDSAMKGTFTRNENVITVTEIDTNVKYYFEINEENHTFVKLEYAPYTAIYAKSDNKPDNNYTIKLDGKGGAVYTTPSGETVGQVVKSNKKTNLGEEIYSFVSDSVNFEFISVSANGNRYYLLQEEKFGAGNYMIADAPGYIVLDGYSYGAEYFVSGVTSKGNYYVTGDMVVMTCGGKTYYFDYVDDTTVSKKSEEYGVYILVENAYDNGLFVEFDGYGKLSVFSMEENGGKYERVYIAENGSYDMDGNVYTLTYSANSQNKTIVCKKTGMLYPYADGTYYVALNISTEITKSVLIDTEDWAVLILDEFGGAVKYDANGRKQDGSYLRITDDLLYFVSAAGDDACLYKYDLINGSAVPVSLSAKSYYTKDLKSLYFSKYGFAIFNGDDANIMFYEYKGNDIIIYRRPTDSEPNNVQYTNYGFVIDNFGALSEVKEYKGETYYRNYGNDIVFKRNSDNDGKYPLVTNDSIIVLKELQFVPSGGATFNVDAKATAIVKDRADETNVSENTYDVRVIREVNALGQTEMYVALGYYRFYITMTYGGASEGTGSESKFSIIGSKYVQELSSYIYLDTLYKVYAMYGTSGANAYKNAIGSISINVEFDEFGAEITSIANAEFGEDCKMSDYNGSKLNKIDNAICVQTETGLNLIQTTMPDGYTYRLYFGVRNHSALNTSGYYVYAFSRVQEISTGDYTVVVERVVYSEIASVNDGDIFGIEVKKNGTSVDGVKYVGFDVYDAFVSNGKLNYVVRDSEVTYYTIELKEEEKNSVDEDKIYLFESVTVSAYTATVVCEEEYEERYVEIVDGNVALIVLFSNVYYVDTVEYDDVEKTYFISTTNGKEYTVTIDGEYVVIESQT